MKSWLSMLKISLAAALRTPRTWILALILPLLMVGARLVLPREEQAAPVQAGVFWADESGEVLWEKLEKRSGTVVQFLPSDPETIEAKVATSQWDCGILAAENFSDRIAAGDTEKLLTVVTGPGSVAYPIVQETLAAVVMELASPAIGAEYLTDSGVQADIARAAEQQYRELTEDQRVLVNMHTLDGKPLDALQLAEDQTGRILAGILALILLASALYLAQDLGKWLESGPGQRMLAIRPSWYLLLPRAAAGMLGPALGTAAALVLLAPVALPAGAEYLAVLCLLSAALARVKRIFWVLPVMMPFLVLGAALLSPIVPDIGSVWPGMGLLSAILPVTLFLKAAEGSLTALAGLGAEALILAALTVIPAKYAEKMNNFSE